MLIQEKTATKTTKVPMLLPTSATNTIKMGRNGIAMSTSTSRMSSSSTQPPK